MVLTAILFAELVGFEGQRVVGGVVLPEGGASMGPHAFVIDGTGQILGMWLAGDFGQTGWGLGQGPLSKN